jgi:hypothetical protein
MRRTFCTSAFLHIIAFVLFSQSKKCATESPSCDIVKCYEELDDQFLIYFFNKVYLLIAITNHYHGEGLN